MSEDRATVYSNAAGLLARLGYAASSDPAWVPPQAARAVPALVTDAPPVVVGYAVAMVAEDPEANLPAASARAGRVPKGKAGDPQVAFWS